MGGAVEEGETEDSDFGVVTVVELEWAGTSSTWVELGISSGSCEGA